MSEYNAAAVSEQPAGISELTGLDQVALDRAGGPMAELTDKALYAEIDSNRRAEYRLVTSALVCLVAIVVLVALRWWYLG